MPTDILETAFRVTCLYNGVTSHATFATLEEANDWKAMLKYQQRRGAVVTIGTVLVEPDFMAELVRP